MTDRMSGVFAVPTTPYSPDGSQNLEALASGVERALAAGVDGILCLGATGEALALSPAEQQDQVVLSQQPPAGTLMFRDEPISLVVGDHPFSR